MPNIYSKSQYTKNQISKKYKIILSNVICNNPEELILRLGNQFSKTFRLNFEHICMNENKTSIAFLKIKIHLDFLYFENYTYSFVNLYHPCSGFYLNV